VKNVNEMLRRNKLTYGYLYSLLWTMYLENYLA